MSAFEFDPEALAAVPPHAARRTLHVARAPEGIRFVPEPPAPAAAAVVPLLDAFFDAWQGVAGSLAFRHERLLNLAYVPTTTHADALYRSAQALTLRPEPPLAASTWLALTLQPVGGSDEREVPAGLAVQSVPIGASRPQIYETDAALRAHVAWNALPVQRPRAPTPELSTCATSGLSRAGGLAAGRRLAISGSVDGERFAAAVTLSSAERVSPAGDDASARQRQRRLRWSEPLAPGAARPIRDARAFELGSPTGLFGANAGDWSTVPDAVRYALSAPRGGLLKVDPPRAGAVPAARPCAAFARSAGEPRAVAARGDVWIAAADAGVLRSTDGGERWAPTGRRAWRVTAACWSEAGLFLGTESHGVLRSTDAGVTWEVLRGGTVVTQGKRGIAISLGRLPRCGVRALGSFATGQDAALVVAGTNAGPYYQLVGDPAWYPHADGLPLRGVRTGMGGPPITAVALEPSTAALWLGTDQGLFRAKSLDEPWQPVALPSPGAVAALTLDAGGAVLVALESGALYRVSARGATPLGGADAPFAGQRLRALCTTAAGLWLGADAGCFWSGDGERWLQVSDGAVAALAPLPDGGVLAATRLEGAVDAQWPGFALAPDALDLDRVQPLVTPGPALVIDDASGASLLVDVRATTELELAAFGVQRRVTRLLLGSPEPRLAAFGRRTTLVYATTRQLGALLADAPREAAVATTTPLLTRTLLVDARTPDPTGRTVLVSGPRLRTRLPRGSVLLEADTGHARTLTSDSIATLVGLPVAEDGGTSVRVRTEDGLEGTIHTPELTLLAADPAAPPAVERRHVLAFERRDGVAELTLDEPLGAAFDPSATTVYANVVSATHGQRIENEVLGSGDPTQRSQRFKLMLPLCWLPTADGAEPVLEVRVSGQLWPRVEHRSELWSGERGYALECDANGNAWICFGDGEHGERPPAGVENICARYRAGGGCVGNQPAGVIRLLRNRPPGVKAVKNLLPATGGCDVEPLADLRARIPLHARRPEHIVSLPDFLDHLRTLEGIAKVSARQLWDGHAHIVHLTLATNDAANGWALDESSALAASLLRLSERAAVRIDSVEVSRFAASVEVAVEPDLERAAVLGAVRDALQAAFGFEARSIGEAVLPSALIAVAMGVGGVTNAVVRRLCPLGEAAGESVRPLPGAFARLDAQTGVVRPGRLWLIAANAPASDTDAKAARGLVVQDLEAP